MTTAEAAAALHITPQRIKQYIAKGRLIARKHGRDWWIEATDLETFANLPRPNGRPSTRK